MFKIVKEKEYNELKDKLNKLMNIDTILEKQEKHIEYTASLIFEKEFSKHILNESVNLINKANKLKKESDFIKLTIIELLDIIKQTDIVKKDKKLLNTFDKSIKIIKERLNIIDNTNKSDKDIIEEIKRKENK